MAASNTCWGIEIGAASIKAMKLERIDDERVKVLEYAVIQHPKVLSTPGVDASDVLRVSLGALTSQYDLTKAALAVSVPGHAAFARFCKLPPVDPKKVPDIVKFEAMQQIPFPLEQVEWDYQTFVAPDSPDVGVGIFAITKEKVSERLSLLADLGLNPDVLTLSPLACYNAIAFDLEFNDKTPGTIIVDVGTTSTDIVIAEPGRLWVRTFPIGGHQFTEALVNQFQLSYPKAEKLKREAEDTKHARQVFQAMRPVFTDLATEVQRSIGYYQALHKDANLTRLIGVGSTFRLPGLRKYFKQQLSIDVYRVEEFKKAKLEGERAAPLDEAALNLCTAYGLSLQGLGMNQCGGNLMPVSVVRESMWRGKIKFFATAAGLAVAASAAMFARPAMDYFAIKSRPTDGVVAKTVSMAQKLKGEADAAGVTGQAQADLRAANMVELLTKRGVYAYIVDDLGQMFDASQKELGGWAAKIAAPGQEPAKVAGPAFLLTRFTSEYEAPMVASDDPYAQQPMETRDAPSEPAEVKALQRVKCVLEVTTDVPEPRRFVRDTLDKWLRTNGTRAGVPYKIVVADSTFQLVEGKEAAKAPANSETGQQPERPANPGQGRGGRLNLPPTAPPPPGPDEPPTPEPTVAGGGELVVQNPGAAAAMNIEKDAPLLVAIPPRGRTKVTVTWLAVIPGPETKEGGAK